MKQEIYVVLDETNGDSLVRLLKLEKHYKVHKQYGLEGLQELKENNLTGQSILVSDELLCGRCKADSEVEDATQIIIRLAQKNNLRLVRDDAQVIRTRETLHNANILYRNGIRVPLNDPFPWGKG